MENKIKAIDVASKIQCHPYESTLNQIKNDINWQEKSCAVVCDENKKIFGVISESDILEAEKNNLNLNAVKGWEACSHDIICVEQDVDIDEVIKLMLDNNIHHVLVHDEDKKNDGECGGIISSIDILRHLHNKL